MTVKLTMAEVQRFERMSNRALCHWLRGHGNVIYTAYPLETLSHHELVGMACDILREAYNEGRTDGR